MNILKNSELNLGFKDHKLGGLYDVLKKLRFFKTAVLQDLLTGKKRVNALLNNMEKITS